MKKLFSTIAIIVAFATSVNAQITDVKLGNQCTLDRAYLGFLGGTAFRTDKDTVESFASVDAGVTASWRPTKWFAFHGLGDYEFGSKHAVGHYWFEFNPSQKVTISTGYMGTIASEQRPKLVSGDNHFITFSEDQIPTGAYNLKIEADSLGKFGFGACVAYRNRGLEYQAMFKYNWMKISGWYGSDKKFGSAMTLDFSRVYNITSWRQDQVIANFLCLKFGKNKDYQIISDNGYDFRTNKLVRSETGFLKTFESPNILNAFCIGGLFGVTYKNETKSINAYLFVHPSPKHK